ncbi:hypothetical protein PVAND_004276 [Polypedilum vanderplanki]|uniref:THAP-type domain-containing protein n=1 Tax=Polypedilum vanderplanki TaxID=319348 RepID=A0A9J6BX30_POLVA|nr:hypothetical protein PVAND_004276 [Polypedilum vanderplanki]
MSLCVIPNCHNTKSGGYTLFKLPNEGEKSRSKWIQFIKICGVDTDNLKNHVFICEEHFEPSVMRENAIRKTLEKDAIPTIRARVDEFNNRNEIYNLQVKLEKCNEKCQQLERMIQLKKLLKTNVFLAN